MNKRTLLKHGGIFRLKNKQRNVQNRVFTI